MMQTPQGLGLSRSPEPSPAQQPVMAVMGKWQGNTDLQAAESRAADERTAMMQRQNQPLITSLAGYFRGMWDAVKDHKQRNVEPRLLKCLLARKGEYSAQQLQQIAEEGSPAIYMLLTDEKCSNLESWLYDIYDNPDDEPYGAEETPVPELQPELQQALHQTAMQTVQSAAMDMLELEIAMGGIRDEVQATQRFQALMQEQMEELENDLRDVLHEEAKAQTEKLVDAIKDAAVESGWRQALLESIPDFCTYPCSFLKGPIQVNKQVLEWKDGKPVLVRKIVHKWTTPSPWDIFPAAENRDCQDGPLIERHYITAKDLHDLIGIEGYDADAIRTVIREQSTGTIRSTWLDSTTETERQRLEGRDNLLVNPEPTIPALQIWADVAGYRLLEYGMYPDMIPDPTKHYPVEAWLIGSYVIKCQLNSSPDGQRPYFMAPFREFKGSFWGRALPEVIGDCQSQCNVAARSLARNMAVSSGPQVGVDVGAMPPNEKIDEIFPFKIWQFNMEAYQGGSTSRQPLWFFQPELHAPELLKVYEFWNGESDNKSGIPRYATGGTGGQQGVLRTSSGYAMMLEGATKGIQRVAKNIDRNQIEPSIQRLMTDILINNPGQYRGDVKVQAVGATALLHKEALRLRRNEAMIAIKGDAMALNVIGMEGYAEILRQYFKGLEFGNVVPSKRELQMRLKQDEMTAMLAQQTAALPPSGGQQALPSGASPEGQADGNLMQQRAM
ncbi:MAG: hypothetical protein V3573_14530 [Desulfovibrionaceae bacterium]